MYILWEFLVIAGLVLALGGVLFLAVVVVVFIEAGVRGVITRTQRLASRETAALAEKLDSSPLAQAVGQGD